MFGDREKPLPESDVCISRVDGVDYVRDGPIRSGDESVSKIQSPARSLRAQIGPLEYKHSMSESSCIAADMHAGTHPFIDSLSLHRLGSEVITRETPAMICMKPLNTRWMSIFGRDVHFEVQV